MDESNPHSHVTLLKGGVGYPYVQINIISERGQPIDSTFVVFTSARHTDTSDAENSNDDFSPELISDLD